MSHNNLVFGKKPTLNLRSGDNIPIPNGFDHRSYMGQFGWEAINEIHVPYIFRTESTKVIALRIVYDKIFPTFLDIFNQELFNMFVFNIFTMTEYERTLYNEINSFHCDNDYGCAFFKGEHLINYNEISKFNDFISFIHKKFVLLQDVLPSDFGYWTFDNIDNIVPFYKIEKVHYIPTLYFEGDEEFIRQHSKDINSFGESVLKFLMRLQGITVDVEVMKVITLEDAKKALGPQTNCAETWVCNGPERIKQFLRPNPN